MSNRVLLESIVAKIGNGIDAEQIDQPSDGMLPISRIETIWDGVIDFERVKYAQVTKAEIDKYALQSGDILFSHINSPTHIGKTAIYRSDQTLIHGINLLLIRVDQKKCYPEYLNYYFKSKNVRALFRARCKKAVNQASLNQPDILELEVPLPPLTEQKRIASLLARADRLRQLRQTAHDLGDALLQSVFLEMFGDPETNEKGWDKLPFDDVCTIDAEMVDPREEKYLDLPHIGGANIESVTGNLFDLKSAREDGLISSKFLVHPNNILFSKIRPKLRKVAFPKIHAVCSADIYPLSVNTENCNIFYLLHYLRSDFFSKKVSELAETRTNIPKVNRDELSEQFIPVPPLSLQEEFAGVVARVESLRGRMGESTRQVEGLFESLLAEAFS